MSIAAVVVVSVASVLASNPASATATPSNTFVGSVPIIPPGAHRQGTVPDQTPVHLVVNLAPRDPAALREAVKQISTPGSKDYRHFLSTGEFGDQFGASDAQIQEVREGLRSIGLTPGPTSANRLSIPVDTTSAQASTALHTPMASYRTADGKSSYANTAAPTLPSSFAGSVQGILGLDTVPHIHPAGIQTAKRKAAQAPDVNGSAPVDAGVSPQVPVACSAATTAASKYDGANPADFLSAYSATSLFNAGHTGVGQKVAILSLEPLNLSEINVYRQCFHSTNTIHDIPVNGGANPQDQHFEASLDVEAVMGLAPQADIYFYESPADDVSWYENMATIVASNVAKTVSVSYGACEPASFNTAGPDGSNNFVDSEANLLAQAALQGQTFLTSTGDDGSEGCQQVPQFKNQLTVEDPASQPYVTAVGGTTLSTTTAPPAETVWKTTSGASGGGVSRYWFKPDFQPTTPEGYDPSGSRCGNTGSYCRTIPDVAASADPDTHGLVIYTDGQWVPVGGTSLSAPLWASLVVDMNSVCPASNGFGMLNNSLYSFANQHPGDFNDVKVGNNDFTGTGGGSYAARAGYDLATGLGTPVASKLVTDLCSLPPTFSHDQSFILASFADFLGAFPTDTSLNYWMQQFTGGQPHSTLIDALANSDAWVANIVTRFYEDTLGRVPDQAGLSYWENIIENKKMTVAQAAANFYSSSEYYRHDGSNLTTWVRDLYVKLLGRQPDSGVSYWVSQAGTKGRTWVAESFYQSSESCRTRVNRLYEQLLHREADSAGRTYWAGQIESKGDITLAVYLALSSEYARDAINRFP